MVRAPHQRIFVWLAVACVSVCVWRWCGIVFLYHEFSHIHIRTTETATFLVLIWFDPTIVLYLLVGSLAFICNQCDLFWYEDVWLPCSQRMWVVSMMLWLQEMRKENTTIFHKLICQCHKYSMYTVYHEDIFLALSLGTVYDHKGGSFTDIICAMYIYVIQIITVPCVIL